MPEPLIIAEDLGRVYGTTVQTRALNGVSFELEAGEFSSVVGTSGSGKSTLLNLLGLLDTPTEGRVLLQGRDTALMSKEGRARARNGELGFVFQFHHLLPEFSVWENIAMPALVGGATDHKRLKSDAEEVMGFLGLEGLADKNANELSGGQKQRVAIARALLNRPPIVLADEPTGNLDTENSEAVYRLFRKVNAEWGTTFIVVTHDRAIAQMTDRVLEIRDGRLVQDLRNPFAGARGSVFA